ncbi:MAG: 50S ribosomal protein L27 [Candidatus Buchananbacteria bacterium RIFCSPHIGHO2_01_FULL_39_14]|uniref:Large ribosomal subunit protein bL27 n=1 Tax=Candidatus Buchananbacteria bacterium RIFCSPHIGHO2_01_FULL_39_14 TaxID=1797532 RepID=A0A1G1XTX3_9BACT|nr:MAG: 50S ribosomal protein L27 [Candidatus Buchananbacteria bacterium RIFCSPHIGHO2_01_FULL_39_14]OGY49255.1 MAG: 50S ribosomal protein L27 [Candidatus Buchananbacteria bacterium RIFCSPHIGHO2_02_FULL_39_17]
MAHKKAGGSTALGRDSQAQRLGIKLFAGEFAQAGSILVRQRGAKFRPGKNVKKGTDDTLYAAIGGFIQFNQKKIKRFTGKLKPAQFVNIIPTKK